LAQSSRCFWLFQPYYGQDIAHGWRIHIGNRSIPE